MKFIIETEGGLKEISIEKSIYILIGFAWNISNDAGILPVRCYWLGDQMTAYGLMVIGFAWNISTCSLTDLLHDLLDKEVLTVVRKMPKWTPRIYDGELVHS